MRAILYVLVTMSLICLNMGCAHCIANDSESMFKLASALTKLSSAVESTVNLDNPPPGISDSELLVISTKHDPRLLEPFNDYYLRVLSQEQHSIVLVCTKDRKRGLLEDAGCSSKLDMHLWRDQPGNNCDFTLSPSSVCR